MEISNWTFLVLLTTSCVLITEIQGKCTLTPLETERTIAYACVNGNLSDIEELPTDAEWIEFTVSRINYLPPDVFSRFKNLRRLTFYNCHLKQLSNEVFRGLNKLEWLVMSSTKIDIVRAVNFRYLTNLKRLTLDSAGLVYIEPEVFHNFPKLETLSLRDNDLDCLPIEALGALRNLKTVQIGKNPWLCDCRVSLGQFFERRMIEHGPEDEKCLMENNTKLWDRRNGRKNIYECMTILDYPELPKDNQDGKIDDSSYRHGRFEWRETPATGISSLDRLPDEITWILINDVPIPKITRYAFFRFGNTLRSIELRNCGIETIERESFAGLHKLERLSLIGNRLVNLGHEWFRDLARLADLVLRNNEIEGFEDNALVHLGALKRLDVAGNRLKCMPEYYFRGLVSLRKIVATDNPWLCDCKDDLENYLTSSRIGYEINSPRCDLPGQESLQHRTTTWNSSTTTTSGTIRWSWAYEVHRPSRPVLIRPTTNLPNPVIVTTTPRPAVRPGGCHLVSQTGQEGKIESCLCTRASLVDLAQVPDTQQTIVYSGSIIPTIHNDAFRKFGRYLRRLELRECGIQSIERRAFYGLRILENLVIRGNDLEVVKSEWFEDTRNLRRLDISRNGITRISNGIFERLPYLVGLDVSENRLNCIGIGHLESLRYLREFEINDNPWSCLCITRLVQLMKERNISCKCNPEVLMQTNEGGWGCNGGNLDYPTTGVTRPNTMAPVPVTTTPYTPRPQPTTTDLPPLPPLGQSSGTCYESPETIQGANGGPWYRCANGDISLLLKIPSYITKIEIIDSYVPRLPAMAFARFENLTELVLQNCTLRDVDPRAFAGLYGLEKLQLRNNRFTVVKNGWFYDTKNLVSLDMSDNYLVDIESRAFEELERLEYLNLEGNAFQCIYTSSFVGLPRLRTLEFGRNPLKWRCWQELRQFLEIRVIDYSNHQCPHSGKDLVRNLFKDDGAQQAQQSNSGGTCAIDFTIILTLFIVSISTRYL